MKVDVEWWRQSTVNLSCLMNVAFIGQGRQGRSGFVQRNSASKWQTPRPEVQRVSVYVFCVGVPVEKIGKCALILFVLQCQAGWTCMVEDPNLAILASASRRVVEAVARHLLDRRFRCHR